MKRTTKLLLSVTSGVLAAALALWYGSSVRAEAEQARQEALAAYGGELVSVCVASRDIDAGEALSEANVHVEEWVASLLPDGAVTSVADIAGSRATSSIPERAVICPVYLEQEDGAIEVPAGTVAVSVPVDEEHAVGGAISPGDQVDVYVSNNGVADLLCRAGVIDTSAHGKETEGATISWATLAIEPERVTEVLAATAKGSVSLTLPDATLDQEAEGGSTDDAEGADEAASDGKADDAGAEGDGDASAGKEADGAAADAAASGGGA